MTVDFNNILGEGEENAVSMGEVAKIIGTNERAVRKLVFDARIEGLPIVSSCKGYFFAKNQGELEAYETTKRRRAISALRASRIAKKKPITKAKNDTFPGQLSLFDMD